MKLPVMADKTATTETLWRRYIDIAFDHALALGDEIDVPGGRAVVAANPPATARPQLVWAELDAASHADATAFITGVRAGGTIVSGGPHAIDTVARAAGWHARGRHLLRLTNANPPGEAPAQAPGRGVVLSARAALPAVTRWCEDRAAAADASAGTVLPHLDDPHFEAFVMLRTGRPVGMVGLQSRGQVGLVCDVFVDDAERRSGVGRTLVQRVIELAARSQLLDVFAAHDAEDTAAAAWLAAAGFTTLTPYTSYTAAAGFAGID